MWKKKLCIFLEEIAESHPYVSVSQQLIVSFKDSSGTCKGNQERVEKLSQRHVFQVIEPSSFLSSPALFITMDFHIILLTISCLVETYF